MSIWELIVDQPNQETHRLKVHAGWIVRVQINIENQPPAIAMTYVPDAYFDWKIV